MLDLVKKQAHSALKTAVVFAPWLISMYVFYWLDHSETWTSETPHRGKISVALLAIGMSVSFLIWSYFAKRKQK